MDSNYCVSCGREIPEGSLLCQACITGRWPPPGWQPPQKERRWKRVLKSVIGA